MTTNFEIENNCALVHQGQHIDLHNNFDLVGYDYAIADRHLTLTWTKSKGDWINEKEFSKLILIHFNVFFLNIGYDNKEYEYPADDKCLSGISFYSSSDRQTNNVLVSQNLPDDNDDILYFFETEHFIRVGCDKVEIICRIKTNKLTPIHSTSSIPVRPFIHLIKINKYFFAYVFSAD